MHVFNCEAGERLIATGPIEVLFCEKSGRRVRIAVQYSPPTEVRIEAPKATLQIDRTPEKPNNHST